MCSQNPVKWWELLLIGNLFFFKGWNKGNETWGIVASCLYLYYVCSHPLSSATVTQLYLITKTAHTLCLSYTHSPSLSHTHSLSLPHTHTHTLCVGETGRQRMCLSHRPDITNGWLGIKHQVSYFLCVSLSHTHTHTHSVCPSHTHSLSLAQCVCACVCVSLLPTHTHTHRDQQQHVHIFHGCIYFWNSSLYNPISTCIKYRWGYDHWVHNCTW